MSFNPLRLTFARKLRGLTKTDLAKKSGLSSRSISAHEAGDAEPTESTVQNFASILNLPIAFFDADDVEEIPLSAISFRALSKMTATKRDMCRAEGDIAVMINKWFENNFCLPITDLPDICGETEVSINSNDPELIAERLRMYWGLGNQPIKNMLNLLEAKGIRIFSLSKKEKDADAFSFWYDNVIPFIILDISKSSERCRFDLAHELGHLVMHRKQLLNSGNTGTKQQEKEADAFASSFLMPKNGLNVPYPITHSVLISYKKIWKVSLSALSYRLHKLGKMSDWNYRSIFMKYGRSNEPESIPYEQPQVISKIISALADEGKTTNDIACELNLFHDDVSSCLFGMSTKPKRPHLTLVK